MRFRILTRPVVAGYVHSSHYKVLKQGFKSGYEKQLNKVVSRN